MILDFITYKDKVMGCWAGKNIGGVLGFPYECLRQWNEIDFYTQDLSAGPPPNDDLDLQIVWLAAVERFGRFVNASILGEYWLSYIMPNWVEYGTGKSNMRTGLQPPLSGYVDNQYRDSCGCFIRSEIWACLAPGRPDIATRYAYEDGIVDHSNEGIYGELLCAAMESAAFVESDKRKLIDIGLSYIPVESAVARCVRTAISCYDEHMPLKEARARIHNEAPGTFGGVRMKTSDIPTDNGTLAIGTPGFDCPENVGFIIAGWLYGEDDFGKSLCMAVACGEDTDCTAATLGAIMGIIAGASKLPEKWTAPLNDQIETLCIDKTTPNGIWVPKTVTDLTDRVLRTTPLFLGSEVCDILSGEGYTVRCLDGDDLYCPQDDYLYRHETGESPRFFSARELKKLGPYVVKYDFPTHFVLLDYMGEPYFRHDEIRKIRIVIRNNVLMNQQMWCRVRLYMPEGINVLGGVEYLLSLNTRYGDSGEVVIHIDPTSFEGGKLELLIDIAMEGRHTSTPIKALLLRDPSSGSYQPNEINNAHK